MINLAEAAQQKDALQAALAYAKHGLSVVPLDGKQATVRWETLQHAAATPDILYAWWAKRKLKNIGVVCGHVSNLVVIDLDGLEAVAAFESRFPALCESYTVLTGSGKGKHIYLRPADIPPTLRVMTIPDVGNLEMRSDGCYVVAPPSIHPDTLQPYRIARALPVLEVANLDWVRAWMREFLRRKQQPIVTETRPPTANDQRAIRFAEAAFTGEVHAVRAAKEGNRNNQLNRAAYCLGQLVADGLLSRGSVEMALLSAALDTGLGEPAAWRTIQSGLNAGVSNPRSKRYGK
jgi:hypothetical protein